MVNLIISSLCDDNRKFTEHIVISENNSIRHMFQCIVLVELIDIN